MKKYLACFRHEFIGNLIPIVGFPAVAAFTGTTVGYYMAPAFILYTFLSAYRQYKKGET